MRSRRPAEPTGGRPRAVDALAAEADSHTGFAPDMFIAGEKKAALFAELDKQLLSFDPSADPEGALFAGITEPDDMLDLLSTLSILYPDEVQGGSVFERTKSDLEDALSSADGRAYVRLYSRMAVVFPDLFTEIPPDTEKINEALSHFVPDILSDADYREYTYILFNIRLCDPERVRTWDRPGPEWDKVVEEILSARNLAYSEGSYSWYLDMLSNVRIAFPSQWESWSEGNALVRETGQVIDEWMSRMAIDDVEPVYHTLAFWRILAADEVTVSTKKGLQLIEREPAEGEGALPARNVA